MVMGVEIGNFLSVERNNFSKLGVFPTCVAFDVQHVISISDQPLGFGAALIIRYRHFREGK